MSIEYISDRDIFYVRDVATLCGITEEAVRQWCRSGALKTTLVGRQYYISFEDLVDHFATNRRHLNFLYNTETSNGMQMRLKRKLIRAINRRQNNGYSDNE